MRMVMRYRCRCSSTPTLLYHRPYRQPQPQTLRWLQSKRPRKVLKYTDLLADPSYAPWSVEGLATRWTAPSVIASEHPAVQQVLKSFPDQKRQTTTTETKASVTTQLDTPTAPHQQQSEESPSSVDDPESNTLKLEAHNDASGKDASIKPDEEGSKSDDDDDDGSSDDESKEAIITTYTTETVDSPSLEMGDLENEEIDTSDEVPVDINTDGPDETVTPNDVERKEVKQSDNNTQEEEENEVTQSDTVANKEQPVTKVPNADIPKSIVDAVEGLSGEDESDAEDDKAARPKKRAWWSPTRGRKKSQL